MIILDHYLFSTFKEFLDHKVCEKLQAFETGLVPLYPTDSNGRVSGAEIVGSNTQQWIYDNSISGATIASNSGFTGDWSGAKIDYINSRVMLTSSTLDAPPDSIGASIRRFNSYITTDTDQEIYTKATINLNNRNLEGETVQNSKTHDNYYCPAYFIKSFRTHNRPLAYGGLDRTFFEINVTSFCINEMEMIALGGVFRDLQHCSFYLFENTPLDNFGDLKSSFIDYSFNNYTRQMRAIGKPQVHIEEVTFNPIKSDGTNNKLPNIYIGIAKFKIFLARYPRLTD